MKVLALELCVSILTLLSFVFLLKSLLRKKWSELFHPIFFLSLYILIYEPIYAFTPDLFSLFMSFIISFIIYKFIFNISFEETFFVYLLTYTINVLIQIIFLQVFPATVTSYSGYFYKIFVVIFSLALSFFISLFPLYRLYNAIQRSNFIIKFLLYYSIILAILIVTYFRIDLPNSIAIMPLAVIFLLTLLFVTLYIVKQHTIIQRQEENLNCYENYAPMTNALINDIKSRQHDFNNQINAIRMLPVTHKDYESLSFAISNYSEKISEDFINSKLLNINLPVVAGFIFSKIKEAERSNRKININLKNTMLHTTMPEYDLIKVFGILIDNALEAISEEEHVNLSIDSKNNQIIIVISNKGSFIDENLRKKIFTNGYTTKNHLSKGTPRGYGLSNLMELMNHYEGKIYIDNFDINGDNYIEFCIEV